MSKKSTPESNAVAALLLASLSVLKTRVDQADPEAVEAFSNVETFCALSLRVIDQTPSFKVRAALRAVETTNLLVPSRPKFDILACLEHQK